jgi:hypothetical protein
VLVLVISAGLSAWFLATGVTARQGAARDRAALGRLEQRLAGDRAALHRTEAADASEAAGGTAAAAAYQAALTQLAGDQAALTRAQAGLYLQGVDLVQLRGCLSGVERAMNQLALADPQDAQATLTATAATCQAAGVSGG